MDYVWMRNYIDGMLKYWNAIYYGGLAGWTAGDGEFDDTAGA
jgi:hypothetical protein